MGGAAMGLWLPALVSTPGRPERGLNPTPLRPFGSGSCGSRSVGRRLRPAAKAAKIGDRSWQEYESGKDPGPTRRVANDLDRLFAEAGLDGFVPGSLYTLWWPETPPVLRPAGRFGSGDRATPSLAPPGDDRQRTQAPTTAGEEPVFLRRSSTTYVDGPGPPSWQG